MSGRIITVGDVHGCIDELNELLVKVEYRHASDNLVFVGDLMDRGPDPVGVVRLVRSLGARSAVGNHCERHIRWRQWENRIAAGEARSNPMLHFDDAMRAQNSGLSDDDIEYLMEMPKFIVAQKNWVVVHAGFESTGVPYEQQGRNTVCRIRDVDDRGRMASNNKDPLSSVPGSVPWASRWRGPENVVYGHAVHSLSEPRIDQHDGYACYGIDTGCVFGGRLTALVLNGDRDPEFVQVQARQAYKQPRSGILS